MRNLIGRVLCALALLACCGCGKKDAPLPTVVESDAGWQTVRCDSDSIVCDGRVWLRWRERSFLVVERPDWKAHKCVSDTFVNATWTDRAGVVVNGWHWVERRVR